MSDGSLEAILRDQGREGGAVICHPHPLFGGSMYNNVVEAIEEGFVLSGLSTLRFNFRGVGDSEGAYDEGNGEVNDVIAACTFMRDLLGAGSRLVLCGLFIRCVGGQQGCSPYPGAQRPLSCSVSLFEI